MAILYGLLGRNITRSVGKRRQRRSLSQHRHQRLNQILIYHQSPNQVWKKEQWCTHWRKSICINTPHLKRVNEPSAMSVNSELTDQCLSSLAMPDRKRVYCVTRCETLITSIDTLTDGPGISPLRAATCGLFIIRRNIKRWRSLIRKVLICIKIRTGPNERDIYGKGSCWKLNGLLSIDWRRVTN